MFEPLKKPQVETATTGDSKDFFLKAILGTGANKVWETAKYQVLIPLLKLSNMGQNLKHDLTPEVIFWEIKIKTLTALITSS